MSVKLRITAWFTLMIVLLMAFVVTLVFVVEDASLTQEPTEELIKAVSRNASEFSREHRKKDAEELKSFDEGVYCAFFDENGAYLDGVIAVEGAPALQNGTLSTHEGYYIYDMKVEKGGEALWIRGYISTEEPSELMEAIVLLVCILLPLILVVSVGGGWLIAKHSLKSIDKIIKAVDSINGGDDLSARVGLKRGPSEMKRLSEEFDRMFSRLERSFEAEKQFASDVSHELRTPITVVLGECHSLKSRCTDEALRSVETIEKQSEHMSALIEQLLSITRLQQGTEKFPVKLLNLSEFVDACCEDFKAECGKPLETELEEGVEACFNPSLMSRVLFNLLDNARKYTNEDGRITVRLRAEENGALLTVEDNGIGISEEQLPYLFNRFWQADASRGVDAGVGLGLAMVKEMVAFQGGTVSVESTPAAGSRFTIQLTRGKQI